jgi:cytoskeleton protein RodZ
LHNSEQHFGELLRRARVARGLSVGDVARATKIKERTIEAIEGARIDELPAPVFVRGFVQALARAVGVDEAEALTALGERLGPVAPSDVPRGAVEIVPPEEHERAADGRRRMSVALVVLLILVVATLTLSLLLRHPSRPGGPISSPSSPRAAARSSDRT